MTKSVQNFIKIGWEKTDKGRTRNVYRTQTWHMFFRTLWGPQWWKLMKLVCEFHVSWKYKILKSWIYEIVHEVPPLKIQKSHANPYALFVKMSFSGLDFYMFCMNVNFVLQAFKFSNYIFEIDTWVCMWYKNVQKVMWWFLVDDLNNIS